MNGKNRPSAHQFSSGFSSGPSSGLSTGTSTASRGLSGSGSGRSMGLEYKSRMAAVAEVGLTGLFETSVEAWQISEVAV